MNRCRLCVIPDTRPDTAFIDGICSACIAFKARESIDWEARRRDLEQLLERMRRTAVALGNDYDCIVPSSGGKDSHYQALMLKSLGARPLVVTATTCQLTPIGRQNIDNLALHCTTIEITPNRSVRSKLNRLGLQLVGDASWPEHVAIFTLPFRAAVQLKIPFLFYGENPQNQYGGPDEGSQAALQMTRRWRSEFGGFLGLRPADMVDRERITHADMRDYELPPAEKMVGIEAHFLGQYLAWDSEHNAHVARAAGMRQAKPCEANWWEHENLDNAQTGLHDHLMYRKYGFGRGAAQISVDIRAGRIRRDDAMPWVTQFDGRFPTVYAGVHWREVADRLELSPVALSRIVNQYTNWSLFDTEGAGQRPPLGL
jgi:N-acetyl sugar amidotransferase